MKSKQSKTKLTPALKVHIRKQLRAREAVETWSKVAKVHRISRRNLMGHIRKIRA